MGKITGPNFFFHSIQFPYLCCILIVNFGRIRSSANRICISWALLFYTHVSLCVRIRGLRRMYHRYHMASSRLYYKLKNECPVRRSGRAIVALTEKGGTMVDKALDEKRTHNNSDKKEKKNTMMPGRRSKELLLYKRV